MIERGHTPNNWESGIVGDDRFSLYINFPISVIFESGFISNPIEEELLRKESFQNDIAQSQYNAVIASIRSKFGVDLTNEKPDKIRNQNDTETNIITLSRFFVYYTQKGEFNKAISMLDRIEKFRKTSNTEITSSSYSVLRNRIKAISSLVSKARILTSRKKYAKARVQYTKAINTMKYHPLFSNIREIIYEEHNVCARNTGSRQIHYSYRIPNYDVFPPELTSYRAKIENHSVYTPYIITIADNQSLDEAVELSMSPNNDIKEKIISSLRNSSIRKATYKKFYSQKKRRYVYSKVWVKSKPVFSPGMYIVSFSKSFSLKSVTRVPSIIFDPNKYQNQQFFKNSCLAEKTKEKSL
jgi:tetratricopeptide (TPR) repeat protein